MAPSARRKLAPCPPCSDVNWRPVRPGATQIEALSTLERRKLKRWPPSRRGFRVAGASGATFSGQLGTGSAPGDAFLNNLGRSRLPSGTSHLPSGTSRLPSGTSRVAPIALRVAPIAPLSGCRQAQEGLEGVQAASGRRALWYAHSCSWVHGRSTLTGRKAS
jgi:hypothetical protein